MYNHILLPIEIGGPGDFRNTCAKTRAMVLPGGKITLLHVVQSVPTNVELYVPAEINSQVFETAKVEVLKISQEHGLGEPVIVKGSAGRGIVTWAEENDVDCIVLASHQPAFSDILLGSTAAWVVRHAQCSVHVLRNSPKA